MNTTACSRPPAPPAAARANDSAPRSDSADHAQRGQQFERLLRAKSKATDERDDADPASRRDDDAASDSTSTAACTDSRGAGLAMFASLPLLPQGDWQLASPAPAPLTAQAEAAQATSGASGEPPSASMAALASSLKGDAAAPVLGASAAQAASAWEVSVNQPLGVALQMQATRAEQAHGAESPAAWQLTIGSSSVDATLLSRHAPRLNERLRARSLTHTHVRIEERSGGGAQEES